MSEREKRSENRKGGKNRKAGKVVRYKANFSKNGGRDFFGTTTGIQILISRPYFFCRMYRNQPDFGLSDRIDVSFYTVETSELTR